ncbi:unnamed protein product [Porites lobata]|uniref:Uncharacterized protein n=1 Tax=Porites lobata TaxID=104759 RepID=A0ABN8PR58_9CNID|nr:unnamed protein product [Porites lobata]
MPKEKEQGSSVSTVTDNDDSGTAISPSIAGLIKSSVAESIGALTDNLTQVIEDRLGGFAKRFSEENSSTVEQAVKRRVEKVTPVREKETNSSWTMPSKCWTNLMKHPTL